MPLLGIPFHTTTAVGGAGFGQPGTPAWVYNLAADPRGEVRYRDATVSIAAREAKGSEYDELVERAAAVYPPAMSYARRVARRGVRIFVLEPRRLGK